MSHTTISKKRHLYGTSPVKSKKCKTAYESSDSESEEDDTKNSAIASITELLKEKDKIDVDDTHIYFRTDVTNSSIGRLIKVINSLNKEFDSTAKDFKFGTIIPNPIYLHITSHGGSLLMGMVAHDIIKNSRVPIYTIVEGYAMSAGTIMSIAGQKRLMTKNSIMLIHQLSGTAHGTYANLKDDAENNDLLMDKLGKMYLENTSGKLKKKEMTRLLSKDIYLDVDQCIKLGLIDEIYSGI